MKTALIALFLAFWFSHPVQAEIVFTYKGNKFNTFSGDYTCPKQCTLEGSFAVTGPLTDYLVGPAYPPNVILFRNADSFSFTDGLNTVTNQNIGSGNGIGAVLEFVINALGQPDFTKGWIASISFNKSNLTDLPLDYISSTNQGSGGLGTFGTIDQTYNEVLGGPSSASIANDPGVWKVRTVGSNDSSVWAVTPGVPESSTWAMMLLGLAGLAFAGFPWGLRGPGTSFR
jgi:hypothetical protein